MTTEVLPLAKFRLGKIVTTPTALEKLTQDDILIGIRRHQAGDWGEIADSARAKNELGLEERRRLVSVYQSAKGVRFHLVTEADRSVTTVLLAQEVSSVAVDWRIHPDADERVQTRVVPAPAETVTQVSEQPKLYQQAKSVRSLQIEEIGDRWKGFKPRIRMMGKWLERAGFKPGTRVLLTCRGLGFIELRAFGSISQSTNLTSADEIQNPS